MKEFGLYTVQVNYRTKFIGVSKKLADLKLTKRPCVCVKIGDKNWLVPLSSIDPKDPDYNKRLHKQKDYNYHDNKNPPKSMEIFDDIAKTGTKGYKSVAQYFLAIPLKHKYCKKYRDINRTHIVLDNTVGNKIATQLRAYLKTVGEKRLTGFIKYFVEKGRLEYKNYPINCQDLLKALYKENIAQQAQKKYRINRAEKREQTKQYQKDLKDLYLERGEYAPYQDLSSASQPDLSGYVGKESDAVISKETQQDLHTTQNKNQPQQVRQVGQVEQVGLVGQVGQAQKSQNNVKQKAKAPNSAGKR